MRSTRKLITILLGQCLFSPSLLLAQNATREEIRPRRAQDPTKQSSLPTQNTWQAPAQSLISSISSVATTAGGQEPIIRVALATDVRSGLISTAAHLLSLTDGASAPVALEVARVRVEPHLLSPNRVALEDSYRIKIEGASSRAEAEQRTHDIRETSGEDSQISYDSETNGWVLLGSSHSRQEAEELRGRLEDAGFDATVIPASGISPKSPAPAIAGSRTVFTPQTASSTIRLAARTSVPSREVVARSAATRLFSSSAPLMFASDSETIAPVRFNERPYRGRIEVFANLRGTLTVVNVLGLEDYVRGVVANELSPNGYPSLEALKAQAIAARTYALRNRGQFLSQGFDLLPTTRSQVYRGIASETALSTRAVDQTRGIIATYNGEPINALYTSTCGGRTEDAGNIFNQAVPYLRARECAAEARAMFEPFILRTSREPAELHEEKNLSLARDMALLSVLNFGALSPRISDNWLSAPVSVSEVRSWLWSAALLAHQAMPTVSDDLNRPPAFASALNAAIFGENRADTLLNVADVQYFLAIHDANDVPINNRADVALLLRDGYLSVFPDATLRPLETMSRARVLHTMSRVLEARNLLQLQKGTARPAVDGNLVLRSAKGKDQPTRVNVDAYLFRQIGDALFAVKSVALVGGEPVTFHTSSKGEVDYLEVRPAINGAAADRFSPFSNWQTELSIGQIQSRLARAARGIGSITNLRVVARGSSRRVIDLEIAGVQGTAHVRGGRIRSALGLREQLFVMDRRYDSNGRITGFVFTGRGWGHGVGMCQVGAYGLARQGWTYDQILKAYYTGIDLTRMY